MVGCISRFHPKKRNDVVVEAVKQLDERAHLLLAGAGETEADAAPARRRRSTAAATSCRTPGDDVADYTSAFDIGVFAPEPGGGRAARGHPGLARQPDLRLHRRRWAWPT